MKDAILHAVRLAALPVVFGSLFACQDGGRVASPAHDAAAMAAAASAHDDDDDSDGGGSLRARAFVLGPPGSGIEGIVTFKQKPCPGCPTPGLAAPPSDKGFKNFPEPTVEVEARIRGPANVLTPGAHGIHIHENAVCDPPAYAGAGGHFDPGPFGSSLPVDVNHPFHMGDLPNLIVNAGGKGHMKHVSSRITLSPGPLGVFDANGSTVLVHLNPDRGINGVIGASGGPRIACGIIQPG